MARRNGATPPIPVARQGTFFEAQMSRKRPTLRQQYWMYLARARKLVRTVCYRGKQLIFSFDRGYWSRPNRSAQERQQASGLRRDNSGTSKVPVLTATTLALT